MKKKVRQVLGGLAVFGILVILGAAGMGIAHKALERQTERLMSTTVTVADPSGNRLLQTAKNPGGTDPVSSADPETAEKLLEPPIRKAGWFRKTQGSQPWMEIRKTAWIRVKEAIRKPTGFRTQSLRTEQTVHRRESVWQNAFRQ